MCIKSLYFCRVCTQVHRIVLTENYFKPIDVKQTLTPSETTIPLLLLQKHHNFPKPQDLQRKGVVIEATGAYQK